MNAMLAVDGLHFRYSRKGEDLFNGLTHEFSPGRVTALTGPSGRGKSTLLYVLGLLLTPSQGVVRVAGDDASSASDSVRSRLRATRIGFVFQDSELDPTRRVIDSVVEPSLYAGHRPRDRRTAALALMEQFGLAHRANHRPGQVSGGQAQRLAVCRALLNEPDILLADEPTGNLDRDNASLVLQALRHTADERGCTVVIATHDPFVLEHTDDVVSL